MRTAVFITLCLINSAHGEYVHQMRVAAIFDDSSDIIHERAFTHAVRSVNNNRYLDLVKYLMKLRQIFNLFVH